MCNHPLDTGALCGKWLRLNRCAQHGMPKCEYTQGGVQCKNTISTRQYTTDRLCGNHNDPLYPRCRFVNPKNGTMCSKYPKPQNSRDSICKSHIPMYDKFKDTFTGKGYLSTVCLRQSSRYR